MLPYYANKAKQRFAVGKLRGQNLGGAKFVRATVEVCPELNCTGRRVPLREKDTWSSAIAFCKPCPINSLQDN